MKAKIYVEGGGHKALNRECRRAFGTFLEKAGIASGTVTLEACGSRGNAYETFKKDASASLRAFLLVDSEGPVTAQSTWQHLQASDGWSRPMGTTNNQCHLMVQTMESWFLADAGALQSFYGQGFRRQALPGNPNVEQVSKQNIFNGLAQATRDTGKGRYKKGAHSFEILAKLDPAKVRTASPHTDQFLRALSS